MLKPTFTLFTTHSRPLMATLAFAVFGCLGGGLAIAQVTHVNGLTRLDVQGQGPTVDFMSAQPMPMPINPSAADPTEALIQSLLSKPAQGPSGYSAGAVGTGVENPVSLGTPAADDDGVSPEDWGTNNHPFTTVRADLFSQATNTHYPYRAAGKLYFNINGSGFICSASLIKRGIVVTAAHCVANYGQSQFYSGWQFIPGYRNGTAPYGIWTVAQAWVKTAYYNGTDGCAVAGVVCPDDVAVLILNTQAGAYAGTTTGWFGYWYGGGFTSNGLTQITQLGYPAGLNNDNFMERTDSYGYISSSNSNNTVIGSNMNGGSSGGPWVGNFGLPAALTGETNGSFPQSNVVMGVTSWGYTSTAPKEQGASPFTSNNIQSLINSACAAIPAACS
jgi:V8-like Glu-specific endopeptidase